MPKKIKEITRATLEAVPLPTHAATYTVISHKSIMDYALAEITAMGFSIENEEYRATHDGQIAQGIYKLNYNSDSEMSLMFAWTNSYNKQIRFKCAVGGYVHANQTVMLCGNIGTYARKHTGTADADTIAVMKSQLINAQMYYDNLVIDKEAMKLLPMSIRKQSEMLGVLFAEYEILTTEQASIIRQQMDKPDYFYNGGKDTLWSFYNHVTVSLQQSHPRTWMEDQRMLHYIITNEYDLTALVNKPVMDLSIPLDHLYVDPKQTNLLDQIADMEADVMDEDIRYAANEAKETILNEDELAHQLYGVDNDIEVSIAAPENEELTEEEVIDEIEVQELSLEQPEESILQYTDKDGNTFKAPLLEAIEAHNEFVTPIEEPKIEKLSLDDILIRIPNEEKVNLSPFEKMQQRLEEANERIEVSLVLTPEEQEEYQEELDQIQALEVEVAEVIEDETPWHEETVPPTDLLIPEKLETLQEKLEAKEVKTTAVEILKEENDSDFDIDFNFDLGNETNTTDKEDFDLF